MERDDRPEWVYNYHRDVGEWPPGWDERGEVKEPWALVIGSAVGQIVLAAAVVIVLVFVAVLIFG